MQLPLKGGKNSRRADNNGSGFCFGFFTGRGRSWLPGFGQSKAHHDCEDEIEAASVCKLPAPPPPPPRSTHRKIFLYNFMMGVFENLWKNSSALYINVGLSF